MNDKRINWKELAERAWDSPGWGDAAREEAKHDPVAYSTDKKSMNVDIGPLAQLLNDVLDCTRPPNGCVGIDTAHCVPVA